MVAYAADSSLATVLRRRAFDGGLSARIVGVQSAGRGIGREGQVSRDAWIVNVKIVVEVGEDAYPVSVEMDSWRAVRFSKALRAVDGPADPVSRSSH